MTILRLQPLSPAGERIPVSYSFRLVDGLGSLADAVDTATGQPVIGIKQGRMSAADDYADITLLPQTQLATTGGRRTWWEMTLRSVSGTHTWLLTVPVADVPLSVLSLIAASAAPADVTAALVARVAALEANQLPAGAAGDILIHDGTGWKASDELPIS